MDVYAKEEGIFTSQIKNDLLLLPSKLTGYYKENGCVIVPGYGNMNNYDNGLWIFTDVQYDKFEGWVRNTFGSQIQDVKARQILRFFLGNANYGNVEMNGIRISQYLLKRISNDETDYVIVSSGKIPWKEADVDCLIVEIDKSSDSEKT